MTVPSLTFFTGPMNCGKSTLALQIDFTEAGAGRSGRLFTRLDRSGQPLISSRIGISKLALEADEEFDFWRYVVSELTSGRRLDYLICDEAHFYQPAQIDQLARVVDDLQLDVYCFGILSDFRTELFPATKRLVELCDSMQQLQARPRCWCGAFATHNARVVNGRMVTEGEQVVVGDTEPTEDAVGYEVLCRVHHRRRMTAEVARVTLNPEPLPFGE